MANLVDTRGLGREDLEEKSIANNGATFMQFTSAEQMCRVHLKSDRTALHFAFDQRDRIMQHSHDKISNAKHNMYHN